MSGTTAVAATPRSGRAARILPLPTSGSAALQHPDYLAKLQKEKQKAAAAAGGELVDLHRAGGDRSPRTGRKTTEDFVAIVESGRKRPEPATYNPPSSFDPAVSRAPKVSIGGSPRAAHMLGENDLYLAAKRPGPGQYFAHVDRLGFAGRDRISEPRRLQRAMRAPPAPGPDGVRPPVVDVVPEWEATARRFERFNPRQFHLHLPSLTLPRR